MLHLHEYLRTWKRVVTRYVALSEFQKAVMVRAGLPAEKISVKPNFLASDPGYSHSPRQGVVYAGRISTEKGVEDLLSAWQAVANVVPTGEHLTILGDGPIRNRLSHQSARIPGVQWIGRVETQELFEHLGRARCLVFPSTWYEGMPRVIIEAFARGTPVVATKIGTMPEMVVDHDNGRLYPPGDIAELATLLRCAVSNPDTWLAMGRAARAHFLAKYAPEAGTKNISTLLGSIHGS